jgi:collagenase-like PrtC family protease
MQLSLATNFDPELLRQASAFPVVEVYGKLPRDFVGGGRAGYTSGTVDRSGLEAHVTLARSLGIKFSYLLNASCLGNREWSREGGREIRAMLDYLSTIGVDSITVSIPYLAELIKKRYPHFQVKIGIFANIDSPTRARFWEDLGADAIVLESFSINRDVAMLAAIRSAVRCSLHLIANFSCLPRCPLQGYHMNGISHGSNTADRVPFVDYCIFKCSALMLKEPSLLVKSQWIRPEDLAVYEKLGFSDFKLLERNAPTETLMQRVAAYSRRQSPDNLLELIRPFGFRREVGKRFGWFMGTALHHPRLVFPLYKLLKRRGMLYPLRGTPEVLESKKIPPDFLAEIARRPCSLVHDCRDCTYCDDIAAKAYHVDSEFHRECSALYEKVFRILC